MPRSSLLNALVLALIVFVLSPARCQAQQWVDQRQVGPFVIQATFHLGPYEPMLNELNELERELRRVLALRPCTEPLVVFLFRSEEEHRAHITSRFADAPYRRALFVKQDGVSMVFAYRHAELAIDLRHECTHALLHADLPMLPLWLDEGLAEYFEMPAAERAFGNPHADELRLPMRLGLVRGLKSLEAKRELGDLSSRDYQFAWAWTHFLLHGPKPATEQLWGYIGSVRRSEPPGEMSDRIESQFPDANRELVQHFRRWSKLAKSRVSERESLR